MSSVPPNVAVFFGQVDKRSQGWYWIDSSSSEKKAKVTRDKGTGDRECAAEPSGSARSE
jgi:hypothetical protein